MAETLIATRGGDKLYSVGSHLSVFGEPIFHGFILTEDGARMDVKNVDVLIMHGYWKEIVD